MRRKYVNLILGTVITFVSILLIFKSVSYAEFAGALGTPNYWWLIPNFGCGFLALWCEALRWQTLIAPLKRIPVFDVFSASSIGLMVNNILPFRLGEYVRVFIISRKAGDLPQEPLLITVLVERLIYDLGFLAIVIMGVFFFTPLCQHIEFGRSFIIITSLLTLVVIFIISMIISAQHTIKLISGLLFFIPQKHVLGLIEKLKRFSNTLLLMRTKGIIISAIILTSLIWFSMALAIYCLFMSFSFQLPFTSSFVLLAAVALAMFIPSLPGYIGIFHLATVITLSTYSIADVDARAFSIVFHLSQYIPTTILGIYFLSRSNLSLTFIRKNTMK